MQAIGKYLDNSQPNHQYYDINMFNNDSVTGNPTNSLSYTETRNLPYIKTPSNYYASIVRFSLQTPRPAVPVFIPHVQIGQPDVNLTVYKLQLYKSSTQTATSAYVLYASDDLGAIPPAPPLTGQDNSTDYYNIYSYQQWIDMLNVTLNGLCVAEGIEVAYFNFNVETSLISLFIPTSWIGVYNLLCNQRLYVMLDSIPAKKTWANTTLEKYFLFWYSITENRPLPSFYAIVTINGVDYWTVTQESTSIGLLNPVQSIVFTTSLLSLVPNLTNPPVIFNSMPSQITGGNNAYISPIITDFVVNMENANTYKNNIVYTPAGEYRLIDCLSETPLTSIQVSVFWKDIYGNLNPFKLASGCNASLKIMFRRKDYIANSF